MWPQLVVLAAPGGEALALVREVLAALFLADVSECRKEDLERGQPLLAVEHLTPRHVRRGRLLLIQNHRPEEVKRRVTAAFEVLGEFPGNVLPEGLPVLLTIPHVLPLEQGYFDLHLGLEEIEHSCGVRFHAEPLIAGNVRWMITAS